MSSQKTQVPLPELVHLSLKPLIFWFRIVVTAEIVIGDGHAGRGHFRLFSGVWSFSRAYGGALSFCCSHWEAAHYDVSAGGHLKAADSSGRWDGFRADPGRGLRFMNSVFRARERWWWWWGRGWRWWCWRWGVGGRWDYDCWILSSVWVLITGHRNLKWRMSMYMNLLYIFQAYILRPSAHWEVYKATWNRSGLKAFSVGDVAGSFSSALVCPSGWVTDTEICKRECVYKYEWV